MDPEADLHADVRQAQGGHRAARERLARAWLPRVYAVALAVMGERHEAEEVTQDAFAKAFRGLATLRVPDRFGPWLMQIARNTARDRLRKRKRRPRTQPLEDEAHLAIVGGAAPATEPAVAAWSALAEQPRLVVWLRVHDEMPFRDIAELLGMSKSRAFRIFRDAIAALRMEVSP